MNFNKQIYCEVCLVSDTSQFHTDSLNDDIVYRGAVTMNSSSTLLSID